MSTAFRQALDGITRVRGVRGAMLVAGEDGLLQRASPGEVAHLADRDGEVGARLEHVRVVLGQDAGELDDDALYEAITAWFGIGALALLLAGCDILPDWFGKPEGPPLPGAPPVRGASA